MSERTSLPSMVAMGIPPERAQVKLRHTRRGWLLCLIGALCIGGAFAFVIYTMRVTKGAPSVALLVFAALLALPGFYFLLAGGHLISGDAMRAAEASGNVVARTAARVLRVARGKDRS